MPLKFFFIRTEINGFHNDTNKEKLVSDYIKSLLNFIQFCSVILNQFGFPSNAFDSASSQTLQLFSGYFFSFFSLDCLLQNLQNYPASIYVKVLITSIIPVLLICLIGSFLPKMKKSSRFLVCLSTTVFLLQPIIIQSLLTILKCRNIFGDTYYLSDDMTIPCYTKEHFYWIFILVIPSFAIYVIMLPGFFLMKVYIGKRKIKDDYDFRQRVGYLIHGFKKKVFYWEYFLLWEKLILILIAIFWPEIYSKVFVSLLFLLLVTGVEHKAQPLLTKKLNDLELNCHLSLIGILLFSALKLNNDEASFDFLLSIVVFAIQLQFLFHCVLSIVGHKLDASTITINENSPRHKKLLARASQYFDNDGMKKEEKEYNDNILGVEQLEKVLCFRNAMKNFKESNEKEKKEIDEHEVIKMLGLNIKKLKKIVKCLQEENKALKKELLEMKENMTLSSPTTNPNQNLLKKINECKEEKEKSSKENNNESNDQKKIKWAWYRKKIEEDFCDLMMNVTRTNINFKNKEVNKGEVRKCKVLDFNFINIGNIGEESIKNLRIKLKVADSYIFIYVFLFLIFIKDLISCGKSEFFFDEIAVNDQRKFKLLLKKFRVDENLNYRIALSISYR